VNRTVLYIEDSADNVRLVQRLLGRIPETELQVATTARDGVRAAVEVRPALILLDNRLPDATGGEVLRRLAADQATAGIPVIVVSGDSGGDTARELLAIGAADFLSKPFDIHRFVDLVSRYLPETTA
jgi:CheY-like chemotaxis protein